MSPEAALDHWLAVRLDPAAAGWLADCAAGLAGDGTDRDLFRCISLVARKLGKAALALDSQELAMADQARPGWQPVAWTVDQAGRVRLLLATAGDGSSFAQRLDALCATADVDELVAFYRGLPLYPDPPSLRRRAAEGLRTNMRVVFEAVAHHNPYPAEQLPEDAWNQMVLKALFIGSRLDPIVGLDARANAALARMLGDYAHERWAASRPVSPELWRCVGPFAAGPLIADLDRVLAKGTPAERCAAVLALRAATDPAARGVLERHAAFRDAVAARGAGWPFILDFN